MCKDTSPVTLRMSSAQTESESTGDSCGTALASRTFTIASDGTVTAAGAAAAAAAAAAVSGGREAAHSGAQHAQHFEKYVQKLRKRLREGVKMRRGTGDGWKVRPVSVSVAALVTKKAVANIFPTGVAEGVCGMCVQQCTGLSLQLVSSSEESVTLTPLCASCVVAFNVAKPKRGEPVRKIDKLYSVWKRLAKVEFKGREDRREKVAYFKRMVKAAEEKASMVEPTDEAWNKATAEEQRLFLVGLAKELRRVNGAASQSQRAKKQKEKEGRNRAEERRMVMEQEDLEHCVADYLA